MRATIYTLAASAAMLVLALSMPFTAIVSAASPASAVSAPYPTEITPVPPTPEPAIPAEDPLPLDQNLQPQENQAAVAAAAAPTISIWDRNQLIFGLLGNPQNTINIRGNVRDPDIGGSITYVGYRIDSNPSFIQIEFATDDNHNTGNPRLARKGDFNIELAASSFSIGTHTVTILARDNSNISTEAYSTFEIRRNGPWPFPYSTNWSVNVPINQRAQIIDGNWQYDTTLGKLGVSPVSSSVGYDRLIAIGDVSWENYIVTVPVRVRSNGPVPGNTSCTNCEGGVGIIANWQGHNGGGALPSTWSVLGAYGYYSYRLGGLAMWLNQNQNIAAKNRGLFQLQYNKNYVFQLRAERLSADRGRYSLRVWEEGASIPAWDAPQFDGVFNVVEASGDQTQGSVLLVAHYVDATFGDVTISPLNAPIVPLDNKQFVPMIRK